MNSLKSNCPVCGCDEEFVLKYDAGSKFQKHAECPCCGITPSYKGNVTEKLCKKIIVKSQYGQLELRCTGYLVQQDRIIEDINNGLYNKSIHYKEFIKV